MCALADFTEVKKSTRDQIPLPERIATTMFALLVRVSGVDSCFNVHASPRRTAANVECPADNVLLLLIEPPQPERPGYVS
jgi:hypothetical protein